MSVTAVAGFRAAGVAAGLKSSGAPDVALVVNDGPSASAAAVYTTNRCKAHPVLWSERASADGVVRAVVLNSGGANCYTGPAGFATTHATAEQVAALLSVSALDVVVCSTGLIGEQLDAVRLAAGVEAAAGALARDGGAAAAAAIMTTDSHPKQSLVRGPGWAVGGMAKGAGMLAPALATMLVVLTTDALVDAATCDRALREATRLTFDRLDSDGCMSTNDTVVLMASGASGITPSAEELTETVRAVCHDLAQQLMRDAEGADHDIAIEVRGAASEDDAVEVGRAVARSNLFKAAVFGKDPNWGRILAAAGTTRAEFDPQLLDVAMNGVWIAKGGQPGEPRDLVDLGPREVHIVVDLHAGGDDGHGLDERPDPCVRARELGVQLVNANLKAQVLVEALPWLERFHGALVVVKFGGHAMDDPELTAAFAEDIVFLRYAGLRPVVVHGGGPQISEMLGRLGISSEFRGGLRVTSPEAMDVVRMVLTGQVGRGLVGLINRHGPFAVGMSGEDAHLLGARRRGTVVDGEDVDLGLVGEVVEVRPEAVLDLLQAGRIPVISSVAPDVDSADGQVLNVNADTAAAALAVALGATKLVVLTDVEGLYADWPDRTSLVSRASASEVEKLLPTLQAGMVPKMEACLQAVRGGVPQAHVVDGRVPHSILLEVFTPEGAGTMVLPDE